MSYYFVNIPKLQPELSHQRGSVTIVEYTVEEGDPVKEGQTLAIVENWWARMALKAVGSGYISKTFFEPRTHVQEGHPIAIVVCDPEDAPRGEATCAVEVVATIRQKPGRS